MLVLSWQVCADKIKTTLTLNLLTPTGSSGTVLLQLCESLNKKLDSYVDLPTAVRKLPKLFPDNAASCSTSTVLPWVWEHTDISFTQQIYRLIKNDTVLLKGQQAFWMYSIHVLKGKHWLVICRMSFSSSFKLFPLALVHSPVAEYPVNFGRMYRYKIY